MNKLNKEAKDVSGGIIREVSIGELNVSCPDCGKNIAISSRVNGERYVTCPDCGKTIDLYAQPQSSHIKQ